MAEIVVRSPQATWDAVRAELGSNASLLPRSLPVFLVSSLSLPVAVADQLDLTNPVYAAAETEGESIGVVFAIHTRSGSAVAQTLARLSTQDAQPAAPFILDVTDEYLIVANGATAMSSLAAYTARTLPMRAASRHEATLVLPRSALGGPILATLRRGWEAWKKQREADDAAMRAQHGGSAPDFGDPAQALSDLEGKASRLFSVLADLDELRTDIDLEAAAHLARVSMSYRPLSATGPAAEEIAGMDTGDAEPVLSLPQSSLVALLWRESAAARQRSAEQQVESLSKVFGERLGRDDRTKLDSTLRSWANGRGDWLAAGALWSESVRSIVLRAPVADADVMAKAPEKLLDLLAIPAVAGPVSAWIGEFKLAPVNVGAPQGPEKATVRSIHMTRRAPKAQGRKATMPQPEPFDFVWQVGPQAFLAAAGQGAHKALSAMQRESVEPTLSDNPDVAAAVRHLGAKVSFLAVADPSRVFESVRSARGADRASPILLAYGKSHTELSGHARGWLELQCPIPVILELIGRQAAASTSPGRPLR